VPLLLLLLLSSVPIIHFLSTALLTGITRLLCLWGKEMLPACSAGAKFLPSPLLKTAIWVLKEVKKSNFWKF
jgi:hypothetical protein